MESPLICCIDITIYQKSLVIAIKKQLLVTIIEKNDWMTFYETILIRGFDFVTSLPD
jgi:hypothetical protein